jgi:hypothetical protein
MPTAGRNPLNRLDERLFPTVDVLERPAAGLRGGAGRTRTSNQTVIAETRVRLRGGLGGLERPTKRLEAGGAQGIDRF